MSVAYRYVLITLAIALLTLSACSSKKSTQPAVAPLLSWTFDNDLDGWTAVVTSIDWGLAVWNSREGGMVQTDAVGNNDPLPNAWIEKDVDLPAEAKTLTYRKSAHDRGSGSSTFNRVRLVDGSSVEAILQDWEQMDPGADGFDWASGSADISAWAGQTVTLYFETEDQDGGGNNQTYWDDIAINK